MSKKKKKKIVSRKDQLGFPAADILQLSMHLLFQHSEALAPPVYISF